MNKKMRIFRLLASHPIFLFKLNKSGFDECYQSAIKWEFEKSKSQYFQGFAGPHIHFLLIPTRCRNSQLNEFCLEIICSCSSENFDSPYYRSCTMDAYQNLISSDKRYNERKVIIADGSRSSMSILQHNVTFLQSLLFGV